MTLTPHVTVTYWSEQQEKEETYKFKQLLASLTPHNVNQQLDTSDTCNTPLQELTTNRTYRKQISPQEYEQYIDRLLALGADPCAGDDKDMILCHIAAQGNYTIFKKIVAHIAPEYIHSGTFKDTIIKMFDTEPHRIQHTPHTLQILNDLIDLGADIHALGTMQPTVLFSRYRNSIETLQFFLDRGVDQSKRNYLHQTCLQHEMKHIEEYRLSPKKQTFFNTLRLHQAFDSYHITQHADGTTSPGWKDTPFGKMFVHACLECFKGNPELIKKIIIQAHESPERIDYLQKLLKKDEWKTFLMPAITTQLDLDESIRFLAEVPGALKLAVAQQQRIQEKVEELKHIIASLTPQNVDQKLDKSYECNTPLAALVTNRKYRDNIPRQEYAQLIDYLLELGADPCAGKSEDMILRHIASQGNYTIFKKIVAHIAPEHIHSGAFKRAIIKMFSSFEMPHTTSDTLQILTDLIDLGADIHAQNDIHETVLCRPGNTPETLQFFLDRGVNPSKRNYLDTTCLQCHQPKYSEPTKNGLALVKTLLLNQAFNAYHITQHPDGTTSPGWKDTLFGKTFMHACLQCFQGNPELIKMIIIQSHKKASLAGKLEKLLKPDQWATFLIPTITSQLPEDEQELFLAQVPDVLKMTVAQLYQANQESPE